MGSGPINVNIRPADGFQVTVGYKPLNPTEGSLSATFVLIGAHGESTFQVPISATAAVTDIVVPQGQATAIGDASAFITRGDDRGIGSMITRSLPCGWRYHQQNCSTGTGGLAATPCGRGSVAGTEPRP